MALTVLFAFTGEIVLNAITRTMYQSLQGEVQNSLDAYTSLWNTRQEMLSKVTRILADMPEVRLAVGTGDQATISDVAGDLWRKVSDANAIFLVFNPFGKFVASLGGEMPTALAENTEIFRSAAARFPQQVERILSAEWRAVPPLRDAGLCGFRPGPAARGQRAGGRIPRRRLGGAAVEGGHGQRIPVPASGRAASGFDAESARHERGGEESGGTREGIAIGERWRVAIRAD